MARKQYSDPEMAEKLLPAEMSKPAVLERDDALPFDRLSSDEFEVFCYSLVFREEETRSAVLYGKTADKGRDIVRDTASDECEIIQCKKHSGNLGVGEVRQELAKLVVHLHLGDIPQDPDKVVFYVGRDLTSHAIDLIKSRDQWLECVEDELEKHLREAPGNDLLEFARQWWVEIEHQNGHDLTRRAERHVELIEQYFSQKKVVTGDIADLDPHFARLSEKIDELKLQVRPEPTDPSPGITEILRQAETANPGLSVTATSSTEATVFEVRAKPEVEEVPLGKLQFPSTEDGRRGARKFQQFVEEGRPATFEAGEYTWTTELQEPLPEGEFGGMSKLVLQPRLPEKSVPVRLSAGGDVEARATVDFTQLRVLRIGTREIEMQVAGGQFAAVFNITLAPGETEATGGSFTLLPAESPARAALKTLELFRVAVVDGGLDLTSLESGTPLLKAGEVDLGLDIRELERSIEFLTWIIAINERFGLGLRYPKDVVEEDERVIELAVVAIQDGAVSEPAEKIFALDANKEFASELIEEWEEHDSCNVSLETELDYEFSGTRIPLGPEELVVQNAIPLKSLELLRTAVSEMPHDGTIRIEFKGDRLVHNFEQFADE